MNDRLGIIAHRSCHVEVARCGARPSSFWMGFVVNLNQLLHRNMRVYLRRRQSRVPQQFLDVAQVGAAIEQVRRE